MQYCPHHGRSLLPGGYDWASKRMVPATWRPLTIDVYQWAQVMAQACPQEVQLQVQPCDQCRPEGRAPDGAG